MLLPELLRSIDPREVGTSLAVGGAGYVVDVLTFNALLDSGPLAGHHPVAARAAAVLVATALTYLGNSLLT